ncbi:MAG: metal-dependent transcriptional regulator [Clostridia bacterium]|nr:metal-dependent transcriptional regulator [Clostridia bacterium]
MRNNQSLEDYLEAILMLKNENGSVRSIDIAHALGFSKPSVSVAMKSLREKGYATVDEVGHISLTDTGLMIANKVYERHEILTKLLMHIGVDEETAKEDSCKIEHDLSEETFEKLKAFLKNSKLI